MSEFEELLKFKKLSSHKIKSFGFKEIDKSFFLEKNILKNRFCLKIYVDFSGNISTKLFDLENNEEYILHKVAAAQGSFVGEIRNEIENIIKEISEKCFDKEVFKNTTTKEIIKYVHKKYGDNLEFLWKKFPDYAIFRRKDNEKWYCLIGIVKKEKLGLAGTDKVEIIDLRIEFDKLNSILDGKKYLPAYHMNKKNWFTILLDGSIAVKEIKLFLDKSYVLALNK